MITCTILPHHISNSGSFSHSEVLYMIINMYISGSYLSDDRQNLYRFDIIYLYSFVF